MMDVVLDTVRVIVECPNEVVSSSGYIWIEKLLPTISAILIMLVTQFFLNKRQSNARRVENDLKLLDNLFHKYSEYTMKRRDMLNRQIASLTGRKELDGVKDSMLIYECHASWSDFKSYLNFIGMYFRKAVPKHLKGSVEIDNVRNLFDTFHALNKARLKRISMFNGMNGMHLQFKPLKGVINTNFKFDTDFEQEKLYSVGEVQRVFTEITREIVADYDKLPRIKFLDEFANIHREIIGK